MLLPEWTVTNHVEYSARFEYVCLPIRNSCLPRTMKLGSISTQVAIDTEKEGWTHLTYIVGGEEGRDWAQKDSEEEINQSSEKETKRQPKVSCQMKEAGMCSSIFLISVILDCLVQTKIDSTYRIKVKKNLCCILNMSDTWEEYFFRNTENKKQYKENKTKAERKWNKSRILPFSEFPSK